MEKYRQSVNSAGTCNRIYLTEQFMRYVIDERCLVVKLSVTIFEQGNVIGIHSVGWPVNSCVGCLAFVCTEFLLVFVTVPVVRGGSMCFCSTRQLHY